MVEATNMVYRDFLKSDEGQGFRGEVSTGNDIILLCDLGFSLTSFIF